MFLEPCDKRADNNSWHTEGQGTVHSSHTQQKPAKDGVKVWRCHTPREWTNTEIVAHSSASQDQREWTFKALQIKVAFLFSHVIAFYKRRAA